MTIWRPSLDNIHLGTDYAGQLFAKLGFACCFEIVRTVVRLWEAMGPTVADVALAAVKVAQGQLFAAGGAAVFGDSRSGLVCKLDDWWLGLCLLGSKKRGHRRCYRRIRRVFHATVHGARPNLGCQFLRPVASYFTQ